MRYIRFTALALLAALCAAPAGAQEAFPNRPIRIVVPFPAGGPSDVLARMIGEKMSQDFGQGIVVDNRPGANTVIGAQLVQKAAPDGYTLLMAIDSTLVMNQYLYAHLPYDPLNDFAPITLVAKNVGLLVVNAASDMKTAKDLIAKAKAQPGKLNCGAGTITTKLTCFLFNDKAGIDTVLLPYNGSAEVAQGVLTKSADFVFDGPSAELPLIQSGGRAVDDQAVTGDEALDATDRLALAVEAEDLRSGTGAAAEGDGGRIGDLVAAGARVAQDQVFVGGADVPRAAAAQEDVARDGHGVGLVEIRPRAFRCLHR